MITSLTITNFKCFKNQQLTFKPLTLLAGLNSTGKSSVLQSLLLLRQYYKQQSLTEKGLLLNGDLINIGTAKDAIFKGASKQDKLGFEICWQDGKKGIWQFLNKEENLENNFLSLVTAPVDDNVYSSSLFNRNFHYIEAERIGPRTFNKMSYDKVQINGTLGNKCEYTIHFLEVNAYKPIFNSRLSHPKVKTSQQLDEPEIPSLDLQDQVEAWMGEISPGTRINIKANPEIDLINLRYGDNLRSTNVGFGLTYTLPIIVAVLAAERDTLILVENPEAHLHPRGQTKMGELLALAASCGVQVVIETHSDHVLNGICLAVHGGKLKPEDLQLHYFQRTEKAEQAFIEVASPKINRRGRIDQWPDGFFDEWDKSIEMLLEPVGE